MNRPKKDAMNYNQILTELGRPEEIDNFIENDSGARACLEIWVHSVTSDSATIIQKTENTMCWWEANVILIQNGGMQNG